MPPTARRSSRRVSSPLLGAHVSAAGGLWTAFDRAEEAGCDCMQIFTKNKGAWAAPPLTDEAIRLFRERSRKTSVRSVVVHAAYLINLATPERELRDRSIDALRIEVERAEALGIPGIVVHAGAHKGAGEPAALRRLSSALDAVHRSTRGFRTMILLENSAGQGSSICTGFRSLGDVVRRVRDPDRLGICIDTCHAFAAGYDLRSDTGYASAMEELAEEVGIERIRCLHVNDSKRELGSRVDRHEHIGRGLLGRATFRRLLADRRLRKIPMLFELPPENDMIRVNLRTLRRLVEKPRTGKLAKARRR